MIVTAIRSDNFNGYKQNGFAPLQKALTDEYDELLQKIAEDPDKTLVLRWLFLLTTALHVFFYAIGKNSALGPHESTQKASFSHLYSGSRIGRTCHEQMKLLTEL